MQDLKIIKSNNEPDTFWNGRYRFNKQLVTNTDETGKERLEWEYNELQYPKKEKDPFLIFVNLVQTYCKERFSISEEIAINRKLSAGLMTQEEYNSLYNDPIEEFQLQVKQDLGLI